MEVLLVAISGLVGVIVGSGTQYLLELGRERRIRRADRDRHTRKMIDDLAVVHYEVLDRIQAGTLLELKAGDFGRSFRNRRLAARVPTGELRSAIDAYHTAVSELIKVGQGGELSLKNPTTVPAPPIDLKPSIDQLEAAETRLAEALESAALPDP